MARSKDLKLSHRLFMQSYRCRSMDWSPGTRLTKPLKDATLALITTAGLHLPTQPPFDFKVRGGDFSFREIPYDVDVADLQISHPHRKVVENEALDALASDIPQRWSLGGQCLRADGELVEGDLRGLCWKCLRRRKNFSARRASS